MLTGPTTKLDWRSVKELGSEDLTRPGSINALAGLLAQVANERELVRERMKLRNG
jgi:hypothetical protein